MTDLSDIVSSAFWRVNAPDADPAETREWLEAFDALVASEGRERATFLLLKLLEHARVRRGPPPPGPNNPPKKTRPPPQQGPVPGDNQPPARPPAARRWEAPAPRGGAGRAPPPA